MLGGHRSAEFQDIWCPPGRPTLHNPSHQPCGMDTISGYANSSASWKTQKMIFRKNISNLVKRKKTHSVLGAPNKNFTCLSIDFSKSIIHLFFIYTLTNHQSLHLHQVQGKILPSPAPGNRDCRCFCISPQTPSAPRWSSLRAPHRFVRDVLYTL